MGNLHFSSTLPEAILNKPKELANVQMIAATESFDHACLFNKWPPKSAGGRGRETGQGEGGGRGGEGEGGRKGWVWMRPLIGWIMRGQNELHPVLLKNRISLEEHIQTNLKSTFFRKRFQRSVNCISSLCRFELVKPFTLQPHQKYNITV